MRRQRPTRIRRFVAFGAALVVALASFTLCICVPETRAASCPGCCTPAAELSLQADMTCCAAVGGTLVVSATLEQPPVVAGEGAPHAPDVAAVARPSRPRPAFAPTLADPVPVVLRI